MDTLESHVIISIPLHAAAQPGGVSKQPCLLCEEHPANIKFSPCGHTVLCSRCAERAKRCLQCKVSKNVINLHLLLMYMCWYMLYVCAINSAD